MQGSVKSFNNIRLIIVRKKTHKDSLLTKHKQMCNKGSTISTHWNTYNRLYNVEPNLTNVLSKDKPFSDMATDYRLFRSEDNTFFHYKPNKMSTLCQRLGRWPLFQNKL